MDKQNGQSLAEVLIALGAAILVISALIVITVGSLKNAQFAQNQSKATKYAEEAIDNVKSIRDRDGQIIFGGGSTCIGGNTKNFSELKDNNLSASSGSWCLKRTGNATDCTFIFINNNQSLCETTGASPEVLEDIFKREIILRDKALNTSCNGLNCDFAHEKTLIVSVKWTDSTGEHQSKLETVLTPR